VAPYYTSKIHDFQALESLQSYGFRHAQRPSVLGGAGLQRQRSHRWWWWCGHHRGEALHSICNNCRELVITTRTAHDESGLMTVFDNKGQPIRYSWLSTSFSSSWEQMISLAHLLSMHSIAPRQLRCLTLVQPLSSKRSPDPLFLFRCLLLS